MAKIDTSNASKTVPSEARQVRIDSILIAAATLFAERGYGGTSMQDIASAVGITKAALYYFFHSKDEVYERVVIDAIETHNASAEAVMHSASSGRERLIAFCRAHANLFETQPHRYVASAQGFNHLRDPKARAKATMLRHTYEERLRTLLQSAIDSGEFGPFDAQLGMLAVLSCLNWLPRWWKPSGARKAEDFAADLAELLIDGFSKGRAALPTALNDSVR